MWRASHVALISELCLVSLKYEFSSLWQIEYMSTYKLAEIKKKKKRF